MIDAHTSPIALPPPPPPTDLIQSALFLPLSAITARHAGRKIRTIGQYVASLVSLAHFITAAYHCASCSVGSGRISIYLPSILPLTCYLPCLTFTLSLVSLDCF